MELLVTVDKKYILPFQVMLTSLHINNPGEDFGIYLIHSGLKEEETEPLKRQCDMLGYRLFLIEIKEDYFRDHARELLPPDQDILNAVYGSRTRELDDSLWNYDARNYSTYLLRSGGSCDMDWVMSHMGILHFCGKSKLWQSGYIHRFGILYKHYIQLNRRKCQPLESGFR